MILKQDLAMRFYATDVTREDKWEDVRDRWGAGN